MALGYIMISASHALTHFLIVIDAPLLILVNFVTQMWLEWITVGAQIANMVGQQ